MDRIYSISRWALAAIFFYHGLVPKILFSSQQEIDMNDILLPFVEQNFALISSGVGEIVFAVIIVAFYRTRIVNWICIGFGILATVALLVVLPLMFTNAFNPFSTNLAVVVLAAINLMAHPDSNRDAN